VTGRIPQSFIDELLQRADIVQIVSARVPLTKAGREYKARCPFHSEKTPSFTLSPHKGFYHCFGCGAHGNALGFLMEFDRLEFPVAVEQLAELVGLEMPAADGKGPVLEPLFRVLEAAAGYFRQALREHPPAIEYLKKRAVAGETARDFGLGYAPAGWDRLLGALGSSEADQKDLLAAGLIAERDSGGYYDRFRDRIMFPIRDSRGRVIGFGGRLMAAGEPKYLNSPETAVFHKGRELYGLYEARQALRTLEQLLVVEGYMDVIGLAAHGIHNAVGTLGTATTSEHLRRLFGSCQEIIFCFDGDRAGRDAAWRALQIALPELRDGRQIRFLLLPEGQDPDSIVRSEGAGAFRERISNALPLSEFLLDRLCEAADLGNIDGRARVAEQARPLLARLPEGVYRELLVERLGERIGLAGDRLAGLLGLQPENPPARAAPPRAQREGQRGSMVRQAICLILHFPAIAAELSPPPGLAGLDIKGMSLLLELLATAAAKPDMRPATLLERFRDRPEGAHLAGLLATPPLVDEDGARQELADCLDKLHIASQQKRAAALLARAGLTSLDAAEREELRALQAVLARTGR